MSELEAFLLGILQGITEFLPISSSGHLMLVEKIFGLQEVPMFFNIMLHIGTLFAVCTLLRHELFEMLKHPFSKLPWMIVLATVPTIIIALLFKFLIGDIFEGAFLGVGFIATAILLYIMELFPKGKRSLQEITYKDALVMGSFQGLGTLPGISRSGSTIAGGSFGGLNREALAKFSFLMSIPAILGALVLDIKDIDFSAFSSGIEGVSVLSIIIGTISAAVSGYFAVKFMMKLISQKSMKPFAYYVLIIGIFVVLDQYIFHIIF